VTPALTTLGAVVEMAKAKEAMSAGNRGHACKMEIET
jgi:hypothetical protein